MGSALRFNRLRTACTAPTSQRMGRSVANTMAPNPAKRTKAPRPSNAACSRPESMGVPAKMAGSTKIGSTQQAPDAQQ